jgi:hypothetical protein
MKNYDNSVGKHLSTTFGVGTFFATPPWFVVFHQNINPSKFPAIYTMWRENRYTYIAWWSMVTTTGHKNDVHRSGWQWSGIGRHADNKFWEVHHQNVWVTIWKICGRKSESLDNEWCRVDITDENMDKVHKGKGRLPLRPRKHHYDLHISMAPAPLNMQ